MANTNESGGNHLAAAAELAALKQYQSLTEVSMLPAEILEDFIKTLWLASVAPWLSINP